MEVRPEFGAARLRIDAFRQQKGGNGVDDEAENPDVNAALQFSLEHFCILHV